MKILTFQNEKVINTIIYFLNNTINVNKSKLFKLLYFADTKCYIESGFQITDLEYSSGIPDQISKELTNPDNIVYGLYEFIQIDNNFFHVKNGYSFNPIYFSDFELSIMKEIACLYYDNKIENEQKYAWKAQNLVKEL